MCDDQRGAIMCGDQRWDASKCPTLGYEVDDSWCPAIGRERDDSWCPTIGHEIAALDPLHADAVMRDVLAMNDGGDIAGLADALRRLVPSEEQIARFAPDDCAAALRDLGIVLGSIKRHGAEPVAVAPWIERPLLLLAARTDMVPRDTFSHYGPWNPPGPRQRMYTGDAREGFLIESLRVAVPQVQAAVVVLEELLDRSPHDYTFAALCRQVALHLDGMVQAVDLVRHNVTPEYFARSMRPYFEGVTIGGRAWLGPAAAHMPLYLVDHLLWSSDRPDDPYRGFQHDTVPYSLPRHRALFRRQDGRPSITTRVLDALRAMPGDPPAPLHAAVQALCAIVHTLITFRGRHLVLARAAYRAEVGLYAVGSGGASVELVAHILRLTRDYAAVLSPQRATAHSIAAGE